MALSRKQEFDMGSQFIAIADLLTRKAMLLNLTGYTQSAKDIRVVRDRLKIRGLVLRDLNLDHDASRSISRG